MTAPHAAAGDMTPPPLAHYSHALVVDHTIYCSGCLGTDPKSGQLVAGGIEAQTRQALLNLDAILTTRGSGLGSVVRMTCFLARPADFPGFESVYRKLVPSPPPARATVGVQLIVEGALVEIEATAVATEPE